MPTVTRKPRGPIEWLRAELGPNFAWGGHLFGRRDEPPPDDVHIGGVRLIRGPDGRLQGFDDRKKETP